MFNHLQLKRDKCEISTLNITRNIVFLKIYNIQFQCPLSRPPTKTLDWSFTLAFFICIT